MKKTANTNELAFKKASVTELNDNTMVLINGGTSDQNAIVDTCTISIKCQTKDW